MIPWTYALMRQRHSGVGLNPDFVAGMRNHGNALEAMLLYMQDTWNDLSANEDVQSALSARQATPTMDAPINVLRNRILLQLRGTCRRLCAAVDRPC